MANWTITWVPQQIYTYKVEHKTTISKFESGAEQRRKKWSRPKYRFELIFNALNYDTVDAIRLFFNDTCYGSYTPFYFPNYAQFIKGTGLATVDGGAGVDTLTDSDSGFLTKGFNADIFVTLNGSGSGNDGTYNPSIVIAGTVTVPTASWTAAESANADLEVFATYNVRFDADSFENRFLTSTVGNTRTIDLIEVI